MVYLPTLTLVAAALSAVVSAHPGHNVQHEALERRSILQKFSKRSLAHCSEKKRARGVEEKAILRRSAWAKNLRKRQAIEHSLLRKRSLNSTVSTDHQSNLTCSLASTDPTDLFTDNEAACILQPEVTQGPYYVSGELVRSDVRESQSGVTLHADIQFLDMDTCEPIPNMYMDFWHCNATGVYGGIVANGNGNSADTANLNTTFLRGVQKTDADGVLQMTSIFPGHYTGRATHIHIMAHAANATVNANGTISSTSTYAHHVGQFFFDQDLISDVETTYPYSTNTQSITENADDDILATEAESSDPFMEYVLLGDSMDNGLLAWITVGVNMSAAAVYDVQPAATLTEEGGVASDDNGVGGLSGNGTMPSGSGMPFSGTGAPSALAAARKR